MSLRCAALVLLAAASCSSAPRGPDSPRAVRFGAVPGSEPQARLGEVQGVAAWLERELKVPVELDLPKTYQEATLAVAERRWDLALIGPIVYSRAHETGYQALAVPLRQGKTMHPGAIISRADPRLDLTDLPGKTVGFVDPMSSVGFEWPFAWLYAHGLKPGDYRREFLGNHQRVVRAVLEGKVDVGACYEDAIGQTLGEEERKQIVVLGLTDPAPSDLFAGLRSSRWFEPLRAALLKLGAAPEAGAVLRPMRAESLVAPDEQLFDAARRIDLLVSEHAGL